jgi:hypothetical protein
MLARGYQFETETLDGRGHSSYRQPTQAKVRASATGADGTVRDPAADFASLPADQQRLIGSDAEIAVAVDDFECRQETNYLETYIGMVRSAQEQFIQDNQTTLDQFMAAVEELNL